jgi:hypothetical protein
MRIGWGGGTRRRPYPAATLELDTLEVRGTAQDDFVDHEIVRIHTCVARAGRRNSIEHFMSFSVS